MAPSRIIDGLLRGRTCNRQGGILYLIRANPEKFDLLDQRQVGDAETWAQLALCGDEIYVRELNALALYRWASPSQGSGD